MVKTLLSLLALLALAACVPTVPVPNLDTPSPVPTATIQVPTALPIGECVIVTASEFLNFRSGPSTAEAVIGYLRHGQQVFAYNSVGTWVQVVSNGTIGYVHSHYIEKCDVQTRYKTKRR